MSSVRQAGRGCLKNRTETRILGCPHSASRPFTARHHRLMLFLVANKRKKASQKSPRAQPPGADTGGLTRPAELAKMAALQIPWPPEVDCDETAAYLAALLLANGVACQFVTISTDPSDPLTFTHVYVQAVREDGTKIPMDPEGPELGWEPLWIRRGCPTFR